MAEEGSDVTSENLSAQADEMTVPADVNSVSGLINSMIKCFRALPHIRDLKEPFQAISDLQIWLLEQRDKPLTAQDDTGLQSLQDVLLKDLRLAAKWKRLRLLVEPSTFAEKLRNTFSGIRDSLNQLQDPSKDNIVKQLNKVVLNLSGGGDLSIELNRAETEFKHKFFDFLRENLSKSATAGEVISVRIWLAEQLGPDTDSIKHELGEIKEHGGTLIEGLIVYVTELEERKCTVELLAEPSGDGGGESSDANFDGEAFVQPLDVIARNGVQALGLTRMARVLQGFANLIRCTKMPGGKVQVYEADAIAEAIRLAKAEDGQYVRQAMKLLEALTSSGGPSLGSRRDDIYIEVADHVEVLIKLMKTKEYPEARLLAAKTVVNILVNQPVWHTVRSQYDIVSALVAISNEHPADRSIDELNQADRVCLLGLSRLIEFSNGVSLKINSAGDKTQIIVTVLMKLLREGLMDNGEANLAKDSLVALDTQVLYSTPTPEVGLLIRKHMAELLKSEAFVSHSSIPGRMAIVSIMTKLCALYKEDITEGLFLYLLKLTKSVRDKILNLSDSGVEQVDQAKLLRLSVKLLLFCVTHGKNVAQSVLSENAEARATLEKLLDDQDSEILNEFRLEIMDVLDQIPEFGSQPSTVVGGIAKLVKMLKSSAPACRPQLSSRILKFVKEQREEIDVIEMEKAGVMDALMGLLKEENAQCQQNALLALHVLSPNLAIPTGQLPRQTILGFLCSTQPEVRDAAVGLLYLMVEQNAVNAKMFMETPGALKYTLITLKNWLDESHEGPESASSQKSASALLKMATEVGDNCVRLAILNVGLGIPIKYVQKSQNEKFKELLATMLSLICRTGKGSDQEAVIKGGGHIFLLTCLRENISKEAAAQGLLRLLKDNTKTRGDVLQAGFVTIAVDSVDQRFASTDIALGLVDVCSTSEGMDQIYASKKAVQALLSILEHCQTMEGKGAAAAVIARLYPRLNRNEDLNRQIEMTAACPHLIRYLELEDKSQLQMFLKALAAFATGRRGRQMIHEERGPKPLINYLKNKQFDNEVQGLMLKILAEMSSVFTEGGGQRDSTYHKILNSFLEQKISELLVILPKSEEFNKNTENMKNLLILIRNFSIAGQPAVTQLSEQRAVDVLLKVLKQHEHENPVSIVTELAVKALEKFMDEPSGKQAFIKGNGIQSLVSVLKLPTPRGSDLKSFTTIILTSVAKDPDTRRQACETIFSCDKDLLLNLNTIMFEGETSRIKWQAAVLMKLLAMYGPTSKVCSAIKVSGSLDALNQLRDVQHCKEVRDMANDVLRFVREKSKECRKEMEKWPNSK
ncbi:hypothetical protein M758_6G114000 [Ceratodon purpureus]|nr:hypothetical protein M758_6G114000 [Ceratodon purpureus]